MQTTGKSLLQSAVHGATIAAAAVVRDNPLPSLDTMDFKGGRLFIHTPREH